MRKVEGQPPNLGIRIVKASKYLGVITGNDPDMARAAIVEREARVYKQLDAWDKKLSSSPIDRVMIARRAPLAQPAKNPVLTRRHGFESRQWQFFIGKKLLWAAFHKEGL